MPAFFVRADRAANGVKYWARRPWTPLSSSDKQFSDERIKALERLRFERRWEAEVYVAGVDLGSVAAKAVIMEDDEVLSCAVTDTKPDFEILSWQVLDRALAEANLHREDLSYIVGTGYGRNIVPFSNANRTEIVCHALGVHHIFPTVRTIVDIGGQDGKVIRVTAAGAVEQFVMNERCAAGAGRFITVIGRALRVPPDKWGEAVRSARNRARISSTCTVFAESEVISLIAQKVPVNEIIAGLCESLVYRVQQMVVRLGTMKTDVCFTGGVAYNDGFARVLSERLGVELFIPDNPQFTGALGAAVLARQMAVAEGTRDDTVVGRKYPNVRGWD